jgi:hypothetical protein
MMRRFAIIAVSFALAGLPAVALAAGSATRPTGGGALAQIARTRLAQTQPPRAQLTGFVCQKALDQPARAVSVTAVMRPLAGTQKLAIEFELFEKPSGATAWTLVSDPVVPHLNVWLSPPIPTLGRRPGDVWDVPFPVADLAAPAAYRFRVTFRWTGRHGRVLGTIARVSATCRQPELRPDLTVDSVTITQDPSHLRYDEFAAAIGDIGVSGAGPFDVQLSYVHDQAAVTDDKTVAHIDAHGTRTVQFADLLCDAGTQVTVTANPLGATDQIDVYSRSQASMSVTCPVPTTPVTGSANTAGASSS